MFKFFKHIKKTLDSISDTVIECNNSIAKTRTETTSKLDKILAEEDKRMKDNDIVMFISKEHKETLKEIADNRKYVEALDALFAAFRTNVQCRAYDRKNEQAYSEAFDGIRITGTYLESIKGFNREYHDKVKKEAEAKQGLTNK